MDKRMKQSNGSTFSSTLFDDDEIEVAEILLQLPELMPESDSRNGQISFHWVGKKRRSVPLATPLLRSPEIPSPPPVTPSPAKELVVVGDVERRILRKTESVSTSPATPLSFSPSESEEKNKSKNNNPIKLSTTKRKRDELLGAVSEELQINGLLKEELKTLELQLLQAQALNLELIAKIQEESRGEKVVPCMETNKRLNLKSESVELIVKPSLKHEDMENHHQPLITNDQTVRKPASEDLRCHLWAPRGNNNNIPDLNVSLEDADNINQQFDYKCVLRNSTVDHYNKALAAEARKKRKQIYKANKSRQGHK